MTLAQLLKMDREIAWASGWMTEEDLICEAEAKIEAEYERHLENQCWHEYRWLEQYAPHAI
jgi:hypothetical protein